MKTLCNTYKYLFGPVVSRRYGLSLGVDMIEPKTCSLNCLFCQIGETETTTVVPQKTPSINAIIRELKLWSREDVKCDVITLAGSGEPTLHCDFGRVLNYIKEHTPFPSLLLSNGSLFFQERVRNQALSADIVKLSLHAWDQRSFEKITRADSSLQFCKIIEGYRTFRKLFHGRIDLEVFILPDINDAPEQMMRIAELAKTFQPDSVFLNTSVRPPADKFIQQASTELMRKLTLLFGETATQPAPQPSIAKRPYSDEAVIQLTSRHPASLKQLAAQFDISYEKLVDKLKSLENNGLINLLKRDSTIFISPRK